MDKTTLSIIEEVAKELNMSPNAVKAIVNSMYENVVATSKLHNLKDVESEEEFDDLKTNIRIPGLGKITTNYTKVKKINKYDDSKDKSNV